MDFSPKLSSYWAFARHCRVMGISPGHYSRICQSSSRWDKINLLEKKNREQHRQYIVKYWFICFRIRIARVERREKIAESWVKKDVEANKTWAEYWKMGKLGAEGRKGLLCKCPLELSSHHVLSSPWARTPCSPLLLGIFPFLFCTSAL